MKTFALVLCVFALAPAAGSALAGEREDAAKEAALEWLALIDAGEYAASWEAAGSLFRDRVEQDPWVDQVSGVREPLGKVRNRALRSTHFRQSLPGVPDGEYVIVQFDTAFEEKTFAVETVTPVLEDGEWKVVGYYVN